MQSVIGGARIRELYTSSITILPTYRCNAECEQCCFESNPRISTRLGLETIKQRIDDAVKTFPNLKLVVFSGGECFLLKDDLFAAITYASAYGLSVRCVTNAFWGKTTKNANRTARRLTESGIAEINISTGLDHQRWVPEQSVVNAVAALVSHRITTVVTVERDTETSACYKHLISKREIQQALTEEYSRFKLMTNSWMAFHSDAAPRKSTEDFREKKGCQQIFRNVVITPNDEMSACCGLTFEHIPELKLGRLSEVSMQAAFDQQLDDFLKIWIRMDGPEAIIEKLFPDEAPKQIEQNVVHICQACVILHKHPKIREELNKRYHEFVPDVLSRFAARIRLDRIIRQTSMGREEENAL